MLRILALLLAIGLTAGCSTKKNNWKSKGKKVPKTEKTLEKEPQTSGKEEIISEIPESESEETPNSPKSSEAGTFQERQEEAEAEDVQKEVKTPNSSQTNEAGEFLVESKDQNVEEFESENKESQNEEFQGRIQERLEGSLARLDDVDRPELLARIVDLALFDHGGLREFSEPTQLFIRTLCMTPSSISSHDQNLSQVLKAMMSRSLDEGHITILEMKELKRSLSEANLLDLDALSRFRVFSTALSYKLNEIESDRNRAARISQLKWTLGLGAVAYLVPAMSFKKIANKILRKSSTEGAEALSRRTVPEVSETVSEEIGRRAARVVEGVEGPLFDKLSKLDGLSVANQISKSLKLNGTIPNEQLAKSVSGRNYFWHALEDVFGKKFTIGVRKIGDRELQILGKQGVTILHPNEVGDFVFKWKRRNITFTSVEYLEKLFTKRSKKILETVNERIHFTLVDKKGVSLIVVRLQPAENVAPVYFAVRPTAEESMESILLGVPSVVDAKVAESSIGELRELASRNLSENLERGTVAVFRDRESGMIRKIYTTLSLKQLVRPTKRKMAQFAVGALVGLGIGTGLDYFWFDENLVPLSEDGSLDELMDADFGSEKLGSEIIEDEVEAL